MGEYCKGIYGMECRQTVNNWLILMCPQEIALNLFFMCTLKALRPDQIDDLLACVADINLMFRI